MSVPLSYMNRHFDPFCASVLRILCLADVTDMRQMRVHDRGLYIHPESHNDPGVRRAVLSGPVQAV